MFPNYLVFRVVLRSLIFFFDSISPISILWTISAALCSPAPPPIVFFANSASIDLLFRHDRALTLLSWWFAVEAVWRIINGVLGKLIAVGWWDLSGEVDQLGTEERWRIWIKMLESAKDPWTWLGGMFLAPGYKNARMGMQDPAILSVRMEDVGRHNVQEFISHFLFGRSLASIKSKTLERAAELHSMLLLLELAISTSRPEPFRFLKGRSKHKTFLIHDFPIPMAHKPLIFYATVWFASGLGNLALWLGGFRYYGPSKFWPFPLVFMRGNIKALDLLHDPRGAPKTADMILADKIGYWFHEGSQKAQEEGLTPVLFFHGISGTYGPAAAILYMQRKTGRAFMVPEFPYVTMRLNSPSTIVTRSETVAAARRIITRHGFGWSDTATGSDSDDDEDWRKGKVVLCGHSLGAGPCAWVLRDAPELVAGSVLIDSMSVMLFSADGPRNFFRTRVRTAGEIFFKYFASERGICHFLSRHLRWTDSVIFGPSPVAPLPSSAESFIPRIALSSQKPPFEVPFYAPYVSPSPAGPFPTKMFYSENDCILAIPKITAYLEGSGFAPDKNLVVMPGADHAAILTSRKWLAEVAKAIDEVAVAGEDVEKMRWEDGSDF